MKFQGTDGIRGRIARASDHPGEHPVSVLQEKQLLTEEFFELYAYSYCNLLMRTGFASSSDRVVVAWDSRDREGHHNEAVVRGIRKAGLSVLRLGNLPTPAAAFYMLDQKAVCAFMVTASHNPSDQNGIKIFLGSSGLKLFPSDDVELSRTILETDWSAVAELPCLGSEQHAEEDARKQFCAFSLDTQNSWIPENSLSETTLVIDSANGACTSVAEEIFSRIGAKRVIYSNHDTNAAINQHSGVADIEGLSVITAAMVFESSGRFYGYEALHCLFTEGRSQRELLMETSARCIAIIFDGDADRCFQVAYDPFNDELLVASGDLIAYWQAMYLVQEGYSIDHVIHTVESDIELSNELQRLSLPTFQTAVGDKWILWKATLETWKAQLNTLKQLQEPPSKQTISLGKLLAQAETDLSITSRELSFAYRDWKNHLSTEVWRKLSSSFAWVVGNEESGHAITPSFWNDMVMYLGNGPKTALNSLISSLLLYQDLGPMEYYKKLKEPYSSGIALAMPVYYVDKSMLSPSHEFCKQLQDYVFSVLQGYYPEAEVCLEARPEEPEMLYFVITHQQKQMALFVRNSGTEDKLSVYIRGVVSEAKTLKTLMESIYRFLLTRTKHTESEMAALERSVLGLIYEGSFDESVHLASVPTETRHRFMKEVSTKQQLIQKDLEGWKLTKRGLWFLEQF